MKVLRNILALLLNQIGTWTVTLILTLVLPRYLGPSNYGVFSFAGAFAGFFALGMRLGTGTYLTWRIAREPQVASRLMVNTLLVQIPLVLGCSLVAFAFLPVIESRVVVMHIVAVVLLANAIDSITGTFTATLNGFQIMRVPAMVGLACSTIGMVLTVIGVKMEIGLVRLAGISLLTSCLSFAILLIYTQRKVGFSFAVDRSLWRVVLLGGMPFFIWTVVLLFYGQVDITMLKVMVGDEVVGWYAAAQKLTAIPIFLPSIVIAAIMPALSAERSADSARFRELASRSLRLVMLLTTPIAIGFILLSNQLTHLVHYPDSFDGVVPLMQILGLNVPLVGVDMVLGTVLISMGRQNIWTCVGVLAGIFNPLANLWAIPFTQQHYGNGAIGAAVVTVMTEFIMFAGAVYLRPRNLFGFGDILYGLRILLATAVMAPAVYYVGKIPEVGLYAAILYGGVIYGATVYALKLVRDDEIASVALALMARVGVQTGGQPVTYEQVFAALQPELARLGALVRAPRVLLSRLANTASEVGALPAPLRAIRRRNGSARALPSQLATALASQSIPSGLPNHTPGRDLQEREMTGSRETRPLPAIAATGGRPALTGERDVLRPFSAAMRTTAMTRSNGIGPSIGLEERP